MGFAPGAWGAADGVAAGGGGPGTRAEAACGGDPGKPAGCEGATEPVAAALTVAVGGAGSTSLATGEADSGGATTGCADAAMAAAAATGSGGWSFFPSVRTAATAIAPTRSSRSPRRAPLGSRHHDGRGPIAAAAHAGGRTYRYGVRRVPRGARRLLEHRRGQRRGANRAVARGAKRIGELLRRHEPR